MNDNAAKTAAPARHLPIEAQAQAWLVHLYSGDDAEETRASFRAWLNEDERHRAAFQTAHDLWQSLPQAEAVEAGLPAPGNEADQDGRPVGQFRGASCGPASASDGDGACARRAAPVLAAAAAAAAIAVIAVLALHAFPGRGERALYATAVGETRAIDLPDGSRAILGAETTLEIVFSRRERAVALARGRAFFDVEPDPRRMFRVAAGETRVRVLGTEFEVARRRDNISVSVREGVVAVGARAPGAARDLKLGAGQKVVASLSGALGRPLAFDAGESLAWRDGHLSYANARLGDVIADFNRYRTDKISFADRRLEDLVVTVAGDASQIDQMLAGILALEGLALEQTPSGSVLSANGE